MLEMPRLTPFISLNANTAGCWKKANGNHLLPFLPKVKLVKSRKKKKCCAAKHKYKLAGSKIPPHLSSPPYTRQSSGKNLDKTSKQLKGEMK